MAESYRKIFLLFNNIFRNFMYKKIRYTYVYILNSIFHSLRKEMLKRRILSRDELYNENWKIDSFLTFSNKGYTYPHRILQQAIQTGWFKHIVCANESWIKNLTPSQKKFCRKRKHEGYGLWIWKPVIIDLQLKSMKENEILLYCDSGMFLNSKGDQYLSNYLKNLEMNDEDAIFFSINCLDRSHKLYNEIHDFNQKVMHSMRLSYPGQFYPQIYAGLMILKNTENTRKFVEQWKVLCLNISLLAQTRDADNGLLNFSRNPSMKFTIYPGDEVNIYDEAGLQMKHALSAEDYKKLDWSKLSGKPFQYRRIR